MNIPEKIYEILREEVSRYPGAALAFSGGLDSSLLLHASDLSLIPYTVHHGISQDYVNSSKASELLGVHVNFISCSDDEVRKAAEEVRSMDNSISFSDLGYEVVLMLIIKNVNEKIIVTGQGADELFYGYSKYLDGKLENLEDMEKLTSKTVPREKKMATIYGKTLVTPYLSTRIFEICGALNRDDFIKGGINKIPLREAAKKAGLPEEIYSVRKKAAQYGSGVQKVLRRLYSS